MESNSFSRTRNTRHCRLALARKSLTIEGDFKIPLLYENIPLNKSHSYDGTVDSQQTVSIIMAYPSSTLQLVDILTGKPVANATITADSKQYTSDSGGLAVLDLADGTYTIHITNPNYLSKTLSITFPMTAPLTVKLIPIWSVALGVVAAASIGVGVVAKLAWKK